MSVRNVGFLVTPARVLLRWRRCFVALAPVKVTAPSYTFVSTANACQRKSTPDASWRTSPPGYFLQVKLESGLKQGPDDEAIELHGGADHAVLREQEAELSTAEMCRKHGFTPQRAIGCATPTSCAAGAPASISTRDSSPDWMKAGVTAGYGEVRRLAL
jgi:hypothetical protein